MLCFGGVFKQIQSYLSEWKSNEIWTAQCYNAHVTNCFEQTEQCTLKRESSIDNASEYVTD